MIKTFFKILPFFLITINAQAAVNDPDRLMDWAEITYPQFFVPAKPATQFFENEWVYRVYSDTNSAIGVRNSDRVFVTGGVFSKFGTLVDVGNFAELLRVGPDSTPSISSTEGCIDGTIFPKVGSYKYKLVSPQDTAEMTIQYAEVNPTFIKTITTLNFAVNTIGNSTSTTSIFFEKSNGFLRTISIDTVANSGAAGNITTKSSYSPALITSPLELCQGATYTTNDSTLTTSVVIPGLPSIPGLGGTSQPAPKVTRKVEGINVSVTVPAGTFNTFQISDSEGSVEWTDINGRFLVKQTSLSEGQITTVELIQAP